MSVSPLSQIFRATAPVKQPGDVTISYSQFAMYSMCPQKWKLTYIDKNKFGGPSIHTVFGTSMHEVLQYYLWTMFNKSVKEADNINLPELLQEQLTNNYMVAVHEQCNGVHFSNPIELQEFYEDGIAILDWFKKHRSAYFTNQGYELIAIELPLYVQASDKNAHVIMNGFLDIVIREIATDKIIIIDIKTSTRGWKDKEKNDKLKASQLVLYKSYLAKQYGYNEEKIDIKYFIVKRKLIEGFAYPQKRIQEFVPASGKPTRNKLLKEIENFIVAGFNEDGKYKEDGVFPAVAGGKGLPNCRYCEFATSGHCLKENRII